MNRDESGKFLPTDKPTARIRQIAKKEGPLSGNYFVLEMAGRQIGGTSKRSLTEYARREGFTVQS